MGGTQDERAPLIHDNRNGHGHGHGVVSNSDLESSGHHVHVDFQAHSPFRSFMLFLSLSLHSVFEGLAIGLQNTDSKVRREKVGSSPVVVGVKAVAHCDNGRGKDCFLTPHLDLSCWSRGLNLRPSITC